MAQDDYDLGIPERQVLVLVEDDDVPWHHRISMQRVEGGRWIVVTPTFDVELMGLEAEDVRPLQRNSVIPVACEILFGFAVVDPVELDLLFWRRPRCADVLGVQAPDAPATRSPHQRRGR